MINVTGEEANGFQISPNTVTLFFFVYIGVIIFLHKFVGEKIPYGVPRHMLSHLQVPEEVAQDVTQDVVEEVTPPTGDL